ncbi:MAG: hypothetical protein R2710_23610 [Acidimicrobiales bacterium]
MDELEDFSNFRFDDFDEHGTTETITEEPVANDIRLPNGAALAVVDSDQAVRDYLASQLGEGVATVYSLVDLGCSEARAGGGGARPIVCRSDRSRRRRALEPHQPRGGLRPGDQRTDHDPPHRPAVGVKDVIPAPSTRWSSRSGRWPS